MIRKIKEKLFCPLVSALIQLILIYILFFQLVVLGNQYTFAATEDKIEEKLTNKVNYCGKDYWISWIVIDKTIPKKYRFRNVIGCSSQSTSCAVSIKNLNSFYKKEHFIDEKSYDFLLSYKTGSAGYYGDMIFFADMPAALEMINNSNKRIYSVGVSVVKDIKGDPIYVFLMSNTSKNSKCSSNDVVRSLEDLSIYAKGIL